jgi:hypothetical protein
MTRSTARRRALAAAGATLALAAGLTTTTHGATPAGPTLSGCPVYPATNSWNRDISRAPVDPRSAAYVASINSGGNRFLHADFGGHGAYGIPYRVVPSFQRRVPIRFDAYGDESNPGPYPVPLTAPVERGSDRHVIVLQTGTCTLYEMFNARRSGSGWVANAGAVFHLRYNTPRPAGWTSADAGGLAILPGLARYWETRSGVIRHALRVTVPSSQRGYIYPARHAAASSSNPNLPPMGLRLRLRASYPTAGVHGQALVILTALKRYGLIVADNGTGWYITGAADYRWNDTDLDQLKRVPGGAFEAVQTYPITRG